MTTMQSLNVPERYAMPISSNLVSVSVNNWLLRSRRQDSRRRSKFSSQRRIWQTSQGSLALRKCSPLVKISSSHTKSSTFLLNPHRYTSSDQSSALGVPKALRLSVLRLWKRSHCWIRLTPPWILSCGKKTLNRFILSVWLASSSFATRTTPFSLTVMDGGPDKTGESPGKALLKLSLSSILTFLPSNPASSKFDIWKAVHLFISSQQRILGGYTHLRERYAKECILI